MIKLSIFRNGKEVDADYFRSTVTEECYNDFQSECHQAVWDRFIQKHIESGGVVNERYSFIQDAMNCGYSIGVVS